MESASLALPPPAHVAIIMDGNGRWAKLRGLPRNKVLAIVEEEGAQRAAPLLPAMSATTLHTSSRGEPTAPNGPGVDQRRRWGGP